MLVPPLCENVDCRNWKRPMYGPCGLYAVGRRPDSHLAMLTIQLPETPQRAAAASMMPITLLGSAGGPAETGGAVTRAFLSAGFADSAGGAGAAVGVAPTASTRSGLATWKLVTWTRPTVMAWVPATGWVADTRVSARIGLRTRVVMPRTTPRVRRGNRK